ncbi:hypothetical protein N7468_001842 [Penicillium chermesinum]|uniref:Uncharacterized protein n=1 Tax=Penicillium chermesinum TaxID=63820 RepID=A0A9W9PHB3_9EURO|nr:uncharacterized protein N7468_001842 [Penicillium chermesinum]KAJ5246859.1 hypothetical protein N7468_001842 [Penicillium chermesinum]
MTSSVFSRLNFISHEAEHIATLSYSITTGFSMPDKIIDAALAEVKRTSDISQDVLKSGAYLYPPKGRTRRHDPYLEQRLTSVQGIFYFAAHKDLWKPFRARAGATISLGLGVTSAMFFFTYVPQMAVMAITSGPLAAISAGVLVLSESSTITNLLARSFLVEEALIDTFDGTLVARGQESLVAEGRQLKPNSGGMDAIARLGKAISRPFTKMSPQSLFRSLLYLPLNLIPMVGTVLYITAQGRRIGPKLHARYFQLKGWNSRQQDEWLAKHKAAYTGYENFHTT